MIFPLFMYGPGSVSNNQRKSSIEVYHIFNPVVCQVILSGFLTLGISSPEEHIRRSISPKVARMQNKNLDAGKIKVTILEPE